MRRRSVAIVVVCGLAASALLLPKAKSAGLGLISRTVTAGNGYVVHDYFLLGNAIYNRSSRAPSLTVRPRFEAALRSSGINVPKELLDGALDIQLQEAETSARYVMPLMTKSDGKTLAGEIKSQLSRLSGRAGPTLAVYGTCPDGRSRLEFEVASPTGSSLGRLVLYQTH